MNGIITIKKEWLEKNQKKFIENYNRQDYVEENDKDKYLNIEVDSENNELLIGNDDKIKISTGDDNIYFSLEEKPTIDELLNLAQIIAKYYNKAKTAIEALK